MLECHDKSKHYSSSADCVLQNFYVFAWNAATLIHLFQTSHVTTHVYYCSTDVCRFVQMSTDVHWRTNMRFHAPSVPQCVLSALRPFLHHLLKDFCCTTATVGSGIRSQLLIAMTVFPPTGGSTVLRCGERVRRQARTDLPSHDAKGVRNTAYSAA